MAEGKRTNNVKQKHLLDLKCSKCKGDIYPNTKTLTCEWCSQRYHIICAGVDNSSYEKVKKKMFWFCCDACHNFSKEKKLTKEDNIIIPDNPTNRDLLIAINEIKKSQDFLSSKYDDLLTKIDDITNKTNLMEKRISLLEKENEFLKKKITTQKSDEKTKNNFNEQNLLNCNIIISGVGNNITDCNEAVGKILSTIDTNFDTTDIVKCERLFEKTTNAENKIKMDKIPIVASFSSQETKKMFVTKYKSMGTLLTEECGLPGDSSKVYINDHLTSFNFSLLKEARKLKHTNKIKYAWFQNSNVLVRATVESKIIKINNNDDLKHFQ